MRQLRSQNGVALVLVLILLGVGGLVMAPSLRLTSTALNFFGISRESAEVAYALDAVTQQALWMLENDDPFQDCDEPPDSVVDTFAECVALRGSWDLATLDLLEIKFNESQVDTVNRQQVVVTVELPGALSASVDPAPVLQAGACMYVWVDRTPTWVRVGEDITYTVHVVSCSSSPQPVNIRRMVAVFSPGFDYRDAVTESGGTVPGEPFGGVTDQDPAENLCTGLDSPFFGCIQNDSGLLLDWPSATTNFTGGSAVTLGQGATRDMVFKARPQSWGIFYVDVTVCYFSAQAGDPGPCAGGNVFRSGKVAPVVAGMFNIQGKGKGHAFGASSKKDGSGADIISEQPQ